MTDNGYFITGYRLQRYFNLWNAEVAFSYAVAASDSSFLRQL